MGKIENQFEIIGKNIAKGITGPSSCDLEHVNGELHNLHNQHGLSLLNIIAYLAELRLLKEMIESRLSRNGDQ